MRKIFSQIKKMVGRNKRIVNQVEKDGNRSKENQNLVNAEVMPSGFFDTYQKILYRPRKTIEQMRNE